MSILDAANIEQLGQATDAMPFGSVLASILPPKAFLAHAQPPNGWMLADGQPLRDQKSKLAAFMKANDDVHYDEKMVGNDVAKTPDLRGVFLRGMNYDRKDGAQDPVTRKIGNLQMDEFGRHKHKSGAGIQAMTHFQGNVFQTAGADHDTSEVGGDETRPRNVSLYFYVRVA